MSSLSSIATGCLASLQTLSTNFSKKYVKPGNIVMEVGCGNGNFAIELAKMVGPEGKVYAVDANPEYLQKTEAEAIKEGIENIVFMQLDMSNFLNDPSSYSLVGKFDVVHCRSQLRNQPDPSDLIGTLLSFVKQKTEEQLLKEKKASFHNFLAREGTLLIEEFGETNYSLSNVSPFSKKTLSCHAFAKRFFSLFKTASFEKTLKSLACKEIKTSEVHLCTEEEKRCFAESMQSTFAAKELVKVVKNPKTTLTHRRFIQIAL